MEINHILEYCDENRIRFVFLDFFGTVVTRRCSPDEIKHGWAKKMSASLKFKIDEKIIYALRIQSEKAVSIRAVNTEFKYSELIDEIYRRMTQMDDLNLKNELSDFQTFYDLAYEIECTLEMENQVKVEKMGELISAMHKKGMRLAVVSDFYMGAKAIKQFLVNIGMQEMVEDVFVSCDERCSKHLGSLYKVVLERLDVPADVCLMIGDTFTSDVKQAKNNGIHAFQIKSSDENQHKKTLELFEKIKNSSVNGKLAYSNYCFFLYLYIERLYKELIKNNISDVYFLSREGQFLKRLFDAYVDRRAESTISSHYLYVSRKAVYPAILKQLDEEYFEALRKNNNNFSLKDFFDNIGVKNYYSIFKGRYDIDKTIENFWDSKTFAELKKDESFRSIYEQGRIENRQLIKKYFLHEGMGNQEKIAIVDVGWNGTMQDCIHMIMDRKMCIGYYIGVLNQAFSSKNNLKKGLIFSDNPLPTKDKELWEYDHVFLERILWADHQSTRGYELINNNVVPQFENYESEKENYFRIQPVQESILSKFIQIDEWIKESVYELEAFYEDILHIHLDMIFKVNKGQLILQREMFSNQMQNWGTITDANTSFNSVFSVRNIIKKFIKRFRLLKNTELVFRILLNYNCDWLIKVVYYVKRKNIGR